MGLIHINGLADATGEVFPPVPAGSYPARIIGIEETLTGPKSKNPGRPLLKIKCKLISPEGQNKILIINTVLPTEDMAEDARNMAVQRIKRIAIACKLQVTDDFDTADLMGQEFKAIVNLETTPDAPNGVNNIKDQLPLD